MNNIGESVSIFIPIGKETEFWKVITDCGFSKDGKGIVEYVLEPYDEEVIGESENPLSSGAMDVLNNWAKENPEKWNKVKNKGSHVLGNLFNKIVKKL